MISIRNLSKTYSGAPRPAVDRISLDIPEEEFLVLLGESGCGKTTTLKMINRLIEPSSGTIAINNREIGRLDPVQLRRGIGYVFQEIGLFPHMTIAENIGAVPDLLGWSTTRIRNRVNELLEMLGLPPDESTGLLPHQLSGGQRQRIGVARALAAGAKIMLMDEPFGALDPITRGRVLEEFLAIQKRLGLTVIMVTHDMMEALIAADRIAVMKEGRIIEQGTPHELLNRPGEEYTKSLLEIPRGQARRLEEIIRVKGANGER